MKNSGGSSGNQTSTSQVTLPNWVTNSGEANVQQAYGVASNLLGPYAGARVAGMPAGMQSDIAALQGNVGSTNPAFAAAQDTAAGVTGYQPGQVNPGLLSQTDLSPYMNPYTGSVIASGMQGIEAQRQQALNANADQAAAQHAFGGSRQGVMEAATNAGAALQAGQLASQLENQNYQQAVGQAQTDIGNNLQAQEQNQNAGVTGAGLNLNAAGMLGNLASEGQNAFLQGAMGGLQGQTLAQQQQQNEINANMQAYQQAQQYPIQQLQIVEQALGMAPYGQTTTSQTSLPPSNGLMQGLGAAASGVGILGSLFAPAGGGGLLSGLLAA